MLSISPAVLISASLTVAVAFLLALCAGLGMLRVEGLRQARLER